MEGEPPSPDDECARIRPFRYLDPENRDTISVSVSPYYAKITVNDREYFFFRETGEFDGAATMKNSGPVLIYDAGSPSYASSAPSRGRRPRSWRGR